MQRRELSHYPPYISQGSDRIGEALEVGERISERKAGVPGVARKCLQVKRRENQLQYTREDPVLQGLSRRRQFLALAGARSYAVTCARASIAAISSTNTCPPASTLPSI